MIEAGLQITVVGAGNLAWSLIPALQAAGHHVHQLISRNPQRLAEYGRAFHIAALHESMDALLPSSEICILCVPDQAIEQGVKELSRLPFRPLTLHVSGTTPLSKLKGLGKKVGVLYPLQTFSRGKQVSFQGIPLCLEGTQTSQPLLTRLGSSLSDSVQWMDSETRLRLHLGAVLVSNFPNALFRLAEEQLQD
ncbi:MAG: Rossmann-like and DUF2520 domain-containing protein, partial [Bacteroidota bacterium]